MALQKLIFENEAPDNDRPIVVERLSNGDTQITIRDQFGEVSVRFTAIEIAVIALLETPR